MPTVVVETDSAGGTILAAIATHVLVDGLVVAVVGDAIASHGDPPHAAATMAEGSAVVFANGIPVCRTGDAATCGHTATGSSHVTAS